MGNLIFIFATLLTLFACNTMYSKFVKRKKLPVLYFWIGKLVFLWVCMAGFFYSYPKVKRILNGEQSIASDSPVKPGMHFDLRRDATFACTSLDGLNKFMTFSRHRNRDGFESLLDENAHYGEKDFCWYSTAKEFKYEIDEVVLLKLDDMIGTDKALQVAAFHIVDDKSESPQNHFYTPIFLVTPWEYLVSTPANQNTKPSDIQIGKQFTVNNKDFLACKKMENLVKIEGYISNGDKEKIHRMLNNSDESANCYDNARIFPDEDLKVSGVVNGAETQEAIVEFTRPNATGGDLYYTSIKFVNPFPPPTPSAAN